MAAGTPAWSQGSLKVTINGVTATTGGAIGAIANPEGRKLLITALAIDKTTPSTGAANVDAGVAADATTSNDGLIDGAALNGAGTLANGPNAGTNGKSNQVWGASQYLTFTGSADSSGLVGVVTIKYIPLD